MDIALQVALGLLAAVLTYVGVHMSAHPPESEEAKTKYKRLFLVLGVVSVAVIFVQAKRSSDAGDRQEQLLKDVRRLTEETKRQSERPIEAIVRLPPSPTPAASPQAAPTAVAPSAYAQRLRPRVPTATLPPAVSSTTTLAAAPSATPPRPKRARIRMTLRQLEIVDYGNRHWSFTFQTQGGSAPVLYIPPMDLLVTTDRSNVRDFGKGWSTTFEIDPSAPPQVEVVAEHPRGNSPIATGRINLKYLYDNGLKVWYPIVPVYVAEKKKDGHFNLYMTVELPE